MIKQGREKKTNEMGLSGVDDKVEDTSSRANNGDERVKMFIRIKFVHTDPALDGHRGGVALRVEGKKHRLGDLGHCVWCLHQHCPKAASS